MMLATRQMALAGLFALTSASLVAAEDSADARGANLKIYKATIVPFLAKHCTACHGPQTAEKDLNLATLAPDMRNSTSAARWAVVLDRLGTGKMPPAGEARPDADAVAAVTAWIRLEMKRAGKHVARREAPLNGNAVDHTLLFEAPHAIPYQVPGRLRPPSPEIYGAFTQELGKNVPGLGQPFSPSAHTTFKDMGRSTLDEPTTAQLIHNALLIVEGRLTALKVENGVTKPAQSVPKQFALLLDETVPPSDQEVEDAFRQMFDLALRRAPQPEELARFASLYHRNVKDAGQIAGARYALAAVLLLPEAVFRAERGVGPADERGRVRLSPREIAHALAYALTDRRPESWLLTMADEGKLATDAEVATAVRRMLDEPKLDKPRILRFFREYFQYPQADDVFKDDKAFPEHDARVLIEDTDRLVLHILEQDRAVLAELLTTNKAFVAYKTAEETRKKRAEELAKFEQKKREEPEKYAKKSPPKIGRSIYESYNLTDFPYQQPVELPASDRAGILTQPSWLVAFSKSDENHAILRGKWIRERLLGNVVPDIPITVDAQLPIAPDKTLRARMAVTQEQYCWQCHQLMNDLGYPFEMFDHFGRFRTVEPVLDIEATARNVDGKGKSLGQVWTPVPADSLGGVWLVGDESVEGDVSNAVELLRRLAKSERVEQVFVRHAFRYWMGRDETPGDSATLRAAQRAYRDSGGSMRALIASLLTSESFLYRVPAAEAAASDDLSN